MSTSGEVEITIVDGGSAIVVPQASLLVVMGCCSGGTANAIIATRSPKTLQDNLGYGELPELASLVCLAGGTVLAIKTAQNAAGTASAVTTVGTGTSVTTVTLPNTGITLNFAAGTKVAGDVDTFGTVAPAWTTAGVQAAINALAASPYASVGWGGMALAGIMTGANCSTIAGYMDTLATGYIFSRLMMQARDVSPAAKWGGTAESEATWYAAVEADFAAVSAKRALVTAGHYNMPSAYPNIAAGAPRYRRPLLWALAARQAAIPAQRHAGKVKDGSLSNIVVDPTLDPSDGFIYHDERINPTFDALRFTSATTRIGKPGVFIKNPYTMAPTGSDFALLPRGNVMDVGCAIVHQAAEEEINDDVRVNPNGTILEADALNIESVIFHALKSSMTGMTSGDPTVVVNRAYDVRTNSKVPIAVTIDGKAFLQEIDVTIGFLNSAAAS